MFPAWKRVDNVRCDFRGWGMRTVLDLGTLGHSLSLGEKHYWRVGVEGTVSQVWVVAKWTQLV